jgi:hypothetical protein
MQAAEFKENRHHPPVFLQPSDATLMVLLIILAVIAGIYVWLRYGDVLGSFCQNDFF